MPIELTQDQIAIMGRPCFHCAGVANILVKAGIYKKDKNKAEHEQAIFVHWALGLLEQYGEDWADQAESLLKSYNEKTQAADQLEGGINNG